MKFIKTQEYLDRKVVLIASAIDAETIELASRPLDHHTPYRDENLANMKRNLAKAQAEAHPD
tara:strand:+ start:2233 stop:2418 length:186 start_codon:yes stop_codon:yes gene_type:complete